MDRIEAAQLLDEELAHYASQPHARLLRLVDEIDAYPIVAPSGIEYQVEINAYWSGQPGGAIHVLAGIDDGSFRGAFSPVTAGFLKQPDGRVEPEGRTSPVGTTRATG